MVMAETKSMLEDMITASTTWLATSHHHEWKATARVHDGIIQRFPEIVSTGIISWDSLNWVWEVICNENVTPFLFFLIFSPISSERRGAEDVYFFVFRRRDRAASCYIR